MVAADRGSASAGAPQLQRPNRQLICNSTTLEFYDVRHSVQAQHIWDASRHNFNHTLFTITEAMRHYYKGRQG